jgi:hypothetical protein
MIDPKVQCRGQVGRADIQPRELSNAADGSERPIVSWNSTEIYGRVDGHWRIIHSHWSYLKPELKQPHSEAF